MVLFHLIFLIIANTYKKYDIVKAFERFRIMPVSYLVKGSLCRRVPFQLYNKRRII